MDTQEYITSGTLEFYVYGLLTEEENIEVNKLAQEHESVRAEILSIEKAVINLSYSVSPHLSAENYEKIRQRLIEKHSNDGVVKLEHKRGMNPYIGWAAAVVLMFGLIFQYYKYSEVTKEVEAVTTQKSKFEQLLASTQQKNTETEKALAIVRNNGSTVVKLEGQEISPESYAKVYINKTSNETYVDLAGLPKAPAGKVYQVWALKLDPLTPTSIGVINDAALQNGIFKVDNNDGAQAFGITLEPAGGSPTPTLEQLYALGKV
ncbi:anti-sigma factor [Flavobacterium sp. Sd200]|uniref:anti-sigma factor n=1 Tax=Flavobacterium sp. Sd200 TaxID=2692211 RepID=UPI0013706196|nr:anti-sigma factor [Flavobacterium sp. Sd200]MXN89749.1 anti-sigma factor [Flavobacterium sp. Sd200]